MRHFLTTLLAALLLALTHTGCDNSTAGTDSPPVTQNEANTPDPVPSQDPEPIQPIRTGDSPTLNAPIAALSAEQIAESAFVIIQNAGPTDPQLLIRQLQQVLPKTQVVKQAQSPDTREIKLEVTNVPDLRALANMIPFAQVESIDDRSRTIIVDFEL